MGYVVVIGVFALYWLPTIHAASNKHHNITAIFLLNIFLGWTVIGWIAAMVWSATKPPPAQLPPQYPQQFPQQHPQHLQPQYPQQQIGPWSQQ